jgi:hypothetical protein
VQPVLMIIEIEVHREAGAGEFRFVPIAVGALRAHEKSTPRSSTRANSGASTGKRCTASSKPINAQAAWLAVLGPLPRSSGSL